jgi:hypothetical protein
MKASSVQYGLDCKILTPKEVKDYCGLVNTDDLIGGLWVPGNTNTRITTLQPIYLTLNLTR